MDVPDKLSRILSSKQRHEDFSNILVPQISPIVRFIAYCIMPDHYHLLIKSLEENSFLRYINTVETSYTRYFNIKTKRKGPLWQSSFWSVHISSNEQLLHTVRYMHINPTTSKLVAKPEDWQYSSYPIYLRNPDLLTNILTDISIRSVDEFKKFTESNIKYQQKLKEMKKLFIE